MADKISKLQRWLDVVAFLAGRRFPVSVDQLWEAVPAYASGLEGGDKDPETVRRMFERDKDELRAMGIPIETRVFSINHGAEESHGYMLANKDFRLPYLRLVREAEAGARGRPAPLAESHFRIAEGEAAAALDGLRDVASIPGFPLREEARSAFRKLAFDLDPDLILPAPLVYVEDPETAAAADTLRVLSDALLARKTVSFRYRSMGRDEEAGRKARPYGLLFQHGRWYLVAWAEDRQDIRMFRVGRMAGVSANARDPGTADYDVPADFDLQTFAGRKAWELGDRPTGALQARVRFAFPRSLWAERNGHGTLLEEGEDGSQLREIRVHREEPFLRWVLSLEGDARVEGPPDLEAAFAGLVSAVAERYGGDHG
jgi:proteasome accessory factor B